jgi:hypothetical protein
MKRRLKQRPPTPADVRAIALALPESFELAHMDHPDFRVRNKIFATLTPDGSAANLRTTKARLAELVATDPEAYRAIWGGKWLGVQLAHADRAALRKLIEESWAMTAPKTLVAAHRRDPRGLD